MLTRRSFLASAAAALAAGRAGGAASTAPVIRTSKALGAEVKLTVFHESAELGGQAADEAVAEVGRVDRLLSIYRADSAVSILNREGHLPDPGADLLAVLTKCQELSENTAGAFDVTVQPLWELYAAAKKMGKLPDAAAVAEARARVDYRKIRIDARSVRLGKGQAITLNAIAQGFAADCAAAVLRRAGVRHAMIDTGEVATIGGKPDGTPWSVGIQHPREKEAYAAVVKLRGRCLSTSGDYATTFTEDRALHHIFNPATGRSPEDLASVSIVAPGAADADALSTACLVLGVEKSLKLIESLADTEAMFVGKDGGTVATRGFPI